jgi:hypothetical protein
MSMVRESSGKAGMPHVVLCNPLHKIAKKNYGSSTSPQNRLSSRFINKVTHDQTIQGIEGDLLQSRSKIKTENIKETPHPPKVQPTLLTKRGSVSSTLYDVNDCLAQANTFAHDGFPPGGFLRYNLLVHNSILDNLHGKKIMTKI